MISIQSTFIPDNRGKSTDKDFNNWTAYIRRQVELYEYPKQVNTIRKGGLWYSDYQNSLLNEAKKILKERAKK